MFSNTTPWELKFRLLQTKHQSNDKRILIKEGDEICWHFAYFKLGTESLELTSIGYEYTGFAGWEEYYPEENNVLFKTGRLTLKRWLTEIFIEETKQPRILQQKRGFGIVNPTL